MFTTVRKAFTKKGMACNYFQVNMNAIAIYPEGDKWIVVVLEVSAKKVVEK